MMDDNLTNRMNTTGKKRGRPPKAVSEATQYVPATEVPLPPVLGLVCPCCGRAMTPRITRTERLRRTLRCTLCGGGFTAIYSDADRPVMVRALPR